jgi:signal peptide peptidase SppA
MPHLARIASLIFNTPLLVTPDVACTVANALAERWGVDPLEPFNASRFVGQPAGPRDANGEMRTMYRAEGGIALIGVMGELVNRGAWIGASSGLTSYEGLAAQLAAAERDDAVKGVVLDIDSPGGEAGGAMETAARIRALDAKKPVVAFVNGLAASAAYALASGARTIVVTPSAMLGSIGVVWMHVDRSAQVERAGVKPTLLTAGAFKTDGHSLAPLAADARGRIQAQINKIYDLFVETVAAHRPMTAAAVRATEAGVYIGSQAVDARLADQVGSLDDAFQAVRAALLKSQSDKAMFAAAKEKKMNSAYTQTQPDAAPAAQTKPAALRIVDTTAIYARRAAPTRSELFSQFAVDQPTPGPIRERFGAAPLHSLDAETIYARRAAVARSALLGRPGVDQSARSHSSERLDASTPYSLDAETIYGRRSAAARSEIFNRIGAPSVGQPALGHSEEPSGHSELRPVDANAIYARRAAGARVGRLREL